MSTFKVKSIVLSAAVVFGAALHAGVARAEIITFFNNSQIAVPWASGATSDTIRCDGYQFTYTLDKWWYPDILLGPGVPTGRMTPITWPTGIDAQTQTAGPNGVLAIQIPAQVTITRVDGSVFDLLSFQGTILGNTGGAGANFEVMPVLNGNDGFPDPLPFDATGIAGHAFNHSPNLTGYDTYNISLWMDFGLTGLTVNGAPVPEPAGLVLLAAGAALVVIRRCRPIARR
jgi:hypothetical protein